MLHSRIRNKCSDLHYDLYHNHLRDNPACDCGDDVEDTEHFLFKCNYFTEQRTQLFLSTRQFHPVNEYILLFGDDSLTKDENVFIFNQVQIYIKDTRRFN